jgi:hypothetical protein
MRIEEFLMVKQKEMLEAAFAKLYREFQEKSVQKQATQLLMPLFLLRYYLFSSEDNYLSSLSWLAVAIPSFLILCASKTADLFFHPIVQSSSLPPNETIN